ncbi:hypothetical protein [Parvularcula lutaonensis]|uniref:Uncharacterized protein n=1 Tax=Parvularcula lutaonensis TaxID=491923 RepID=A0ABV7MEH4_9PROT|nr:hypothetical protein [Parvularcula lutaonensis]GGY49941.1 hypothetical protein GCM10007148_18330 [Parvularcula lutaonensis]
MIKGFLRRRQDQGRAGDMAAESRAYDITSARLPGRSIIAFEKRGGSAAALEVTERGAEILKGLAAGAILSELDEVRAARSDLSMPLIRDEGASREEAEAFIQSLDLLDGAEKRALMGALPR